MTLFIRLVAFLICAPIALFCASWLITACESVLRHGRSDGPVIFLSINTVIVFIVYAQAVFTGTLCLSSIRKDRYLAWCAGISGVGLFLFGSLFLTFSASVLPMR